MNAVLREYLLKGAFAGLWCALALLMPAMPDFWRAAAWAAAGVGAGLLVGAVMQRRRGVPFGTNPLGFLLLTLLESSYFLYVGAVVGLLGGVLQLRAGLPEGHPAAAWLTPALLAGGGLGVVLYALTRLRGRYFRFVVGALLGLGLIAAALRGVEELPSLQDIAARQQFAVQLLIGLPFFYLLTFCGEADESELEIAAMSAGLGVGLYLLRLSSSLPETMDKLIFLVPLGLYYTYATRILPNLRVFKPTLRGYGHLSLGRWDAALRHFGHALDLERRLPPKQRGELARRGMLELHRRVDVGTLDPELAARLNYDFCLSVARAELIGATPPTPERRGDALRMLELVERHKPELRADVLYLRAVARTHAKQFDDASSALVELLDPTALPPNAGRDAVLVPAWELATRLHPELVKRIGPAELDKPGRRIDLIRAVEAKLNAEPGDPAALEWKRELYAGLTEGEFVAASGDGPPAWLNYETLEQMGLALVDGPDRERGAAYLRMAGRGLPARGPVIFSKLAEAAEAGGDAEAARGYRGQVKRAGLLAGPKALAADARELYRAALLKLVEDAEGRAAWDDAIGGLRLYLEAGQEDVPTLKRLAGLHEKGGDVLNALLITERALLYGKADAELLAKKASYMYSVELERVRAAREKVAGWFDTAYCLKIARQSADAREPDAEAIQWGLHLAQLARAVRPESQAAMLLEARLRLRLGERDEGLRLLEDLREQPKGSGDDEDAWYKASRMLGDLYLDELNRPDLAVGCYLEYRKAQGSGADTLYQLGRALEASGDTPGAIKSYEAVSAYSQHPKAWDAADAVRRLKQGA